MINGFSEVCWYEMSQGWRHRRTTHRSSSRASRGTLVWWSGSVTTISPCMRTKRWDLFNDCSVISCIDFLNSCKIYDGGSILFIPTPSSSSFVDVFKSKLSIIYGYLLKILKLFIARCTCAPWNEKLQKLTKKKIIHHKFS